MPIEIEITIPTLELLLADLDQIMKDLEDGTIVHSVVREEIAHD